MSKSRDIDQFSRQVVEIMPFMVREFAKRENHALSRGIISLPQMVTLDYVSRNAQVMMSEIARLLSINVSSASVLVDRLIRQKMLWRKQDRRDRRVIWIHVTPKGRQVVSDIRRQKCRTIKAIFGHLSDKERAQYLAVLLKVKSRLDESR